MLLCVKKGTIHLTLIYNIHVVIVYPRTLKKKSYHTYQRRYFKKSAQKFHFGTKIRTWIYLGLTEGESILKLCFMVRLMVIFVNSVNKRNDTLVHFEKKIHIEDRSFQVFFLHDNYAPDYVIMYMLVNLSRAPWDSVTSSKFKVHLFSQTTFEWYMRYIKW